MTDEQGTEQPTHSGDLVWPDHDPTPVEAFTVLVRHGSLTDQRATGLRWEIERRSALITRGEGLPALVEALDTFTAGWGKSTP